LALVDDVPDGALVAFDANAVIYYVEEHDVFFPILAPVFAMIPAGRLQAHVATITFMEVLVAPLRYSQEQLANRYREILTDTLGWTLRPLTQRTAERAASIRAATNLRTPDAIVAATALESGCSHLMTNDPAFRRVEGLQVLVVSDFVTP
jgi:predicted nucleic acid-binding protein